MITNPDWVSPPGDTIMELMEDRSWTMEDAAKALGWDTHHLRLLMNGASPIEESDAARLSNVLGSSPQFWLNREANYRKRLEQIMYSKVSGNPQPSPGVGGVPASGPFIKISEMSSDLNKIIQERESQHGGFIHNSQTSQIIKHAMRTSKEWQNLNMSMRESLEMIAHKISRIVCGDPENPDSWLDIAGYAILIAKALKNNE